MIEFKDLKKQFSGRWVLNGISGQIKEGEIAFVLGTSGTGKSVLFKSLIGLLRIDSGEIWIDGEEVSKKSEHDFYEIRKKCGMVFQQPALFDSLSVFENVAFALRRFTNFSEEKIQQRVEESLALVGVGTHLMHEKTQVVSYGTQKRISIARTLVMKPKVLLFDEPTTGLDPVMTKTVNHLIRDLSRTLKSTSLVVSHDMNCALEIADRIIFLDQGRVLQSGTCDEMRKSEVPLIKEFLSEVEI